MACSSSTVTSLNRSTWVLALALIGALACKPPGQSDEGDQPAEPIAVDDAAAVLTELICSQMYTCACPGIESRYIDHAECVASLSAVFAQSLDEVIASGGTWDAECAGELAKTLSDWECLGPDLAQRESTFNPILCPVLKGSDGLGSSCSGHELGDNCQAGLTCVEGNCVEPPPLPVPVGQYCGWGYDLPCETGSYCDWDDNYETRICRPMPQPGDTCIDGGCGPDSNDLICEAGTCRAAPGEGGSCEEWLLCGPGLYCDGGKDFTCQPRRELGEGCGGDPVCPVDASCVNSICEADPAAVCYADNFVLL